MSTISSCGIIMKVGEWGWEGLASRSLMCRREERMEIGEKPGFNGAKTGEKGN